jgi:hypothetical protein
MTVIHAQLILAPIPTMVVFTNVSLYQILVIKVISATLNNAISPMAIVMYYQ